MSVKLADEIPFEKVSAGRRASRQILIGSDEGPHFALRRFRMEPGGGIPLHTNAVEHEQYVLRGRARVAVADKEFEVEAGSVVFIPAGAPHSYRVNGEEPFEFLCVVPNLPDEIRLLDE